MYERRVRARVRGYFGDSGSDTGSHANAGQSAGAMQYRQVLLIALPVLLAALSVPLTASSVPLCSTVRQCPSVLLVLGAIPALDRPVTRATCHQAAAREQEPRPSRAGAPRALRTCPSVAHTSEGPRAAPHRTRAKALRAGSVREGEAYVRRVVTRRKRQRAGDRRGGPRVSARPEDTVAGGGRLIKVGFVAEE